MTNKYYTEEEKQFLKENYPIYGSKYCAEKLKRSRHSIHSTCNNLGIKVNKDAITKIKALE